MMTTENTKNIKYALVTGASRGIGAAIARVLIQEQYFVIGTATTDLGAQNISNMLGDRGRGVILDVNDLASIEYLATQLDSLDVLVNNAGVTQDTLLLRMKENQWDDVIDTNLKGAFRLSKLAIKMMLKAKKGRIINIASVVGAMGNPGQCNYAAAKAGLFGFTKSLAKEVGGRGITVNAIAPGFIQTDMVKNISLNDDYISEHIPIGRLGQVEDIAHAVRFLASDDAGYITGHILHVNGGMYMG
jgi:3-oxoacyl-[acyl-carrier protein] reductase